LWPASQPKMKNSGPSRYEYPSTKGPGGIRGGAVTMHKRKERHPLSNEPVWNSRLLGAEAATGKGQDAVTTKQSGQGIVQGKESGPTGGGRETQMGRGETPGEHWGSKGGIRLR